MTLSDLRHCDSGETVHAFLLGRNRSLCGKDVSECVLTLSEVDCLSCLTAERAAVEREMATV